MCEFSQSQTLCVVAHPSDMDALETHVLALYERYADELKLVRAAQRDHLHLGVDMDDVDAELSFLIVRNATPYSLCVEIGSGCGYATSWLLRAVDARDNDKRRKNVAVLSFDQDDTASRAVYHPRWQLHTARDVTRFGDGTVAVSASDHEREFERLLQIVSGEHKPLDGSDYTLPPAPPRVPWPFAHDKVSVVVVARPNDTLDPVAFTEWYLESLIEPLRTACQQRVDVVVRDVFNMRSTNLPVVMDDKAHSSYVNKANQKLLHYLQHHGIAWYSASSAFPASALRAEHVRWRALGIDEALTPVRADTAYRNASLVFCIGGK